MEILIPVLGLIIALTALIRGAQIFVDGAQTLGRGFGLSAFVIGTVIVSLGFSLPELGTAFGALFSGTPDIILSIAVGSGIACTLLVLGVMTAISGTVPLSQHTPRTELVPLVVAIALIVFVLRDGLVNTLEAVLLLVAFSAYVWHLRETAARRGYELSAPLQVHAIGFLIGGIAALGVGALVSIDMIERLGTVLGFHTEVITLTLFAFGVSLPELAIGIAAAKKKEFDVAIETIVSSGIVASLLLVGIPALFVPLQAGTATMAVGLPVLGCAGIILLALSFAKRITRYEGVVLLALFAFFVLRITTTL